MGRFATLLIVSVLLLLCVPMPADAGFWRWLDELSGPGGFHGIEFDIRVRCITKQDPKHKKRKTGEEQEVKVLPAGAILPGCLLGHHPLDEERKASFNVDLSYLWARQTNLQFEHPEDPHSVRLFIVRPTFWLRPTRSVEVGAGVSVWRFQGAGFDSFTRVFSDPFLIDVKPIALIRDVIGLSDRDEIAQRPDAQKDLILSVRFGISYSPNGFDAKDFGGIPGTFHTTREVLPTVSVLLDFDPLFRKCKRH